MACTVKLLEGLRITIGQQETPEIDQRKKGQPGQQGRGLEIVDPGIQAKGSDLTMFVLRVKTMIRIKLTAAGHGLIIGQDGPGLAAGGEVLEGIKTQGGRGRPFVLRR